ncbi:TfuA-like protein [Vibrio spartinae]|uniref:TfuA-like protein n=1 Tax=Vibrio spartinae TaxID=1918945 RepID=A0A1N6M6V3_9VIBR|nr:TfuA-like protein [Vibrio spartinae]QMV13918.1 hypothetical protein Vspart_01165 [Vibrio spartinae]SIO95182.1 TfuA-like protein [Vibrio spartinae]
MSIILFSGPTITAQEVHRLLDADCRPPAKQGDIYLATHDKPKVIVLIDGYFESVPAVWHKEILYALSLGINVYGCASMGALRAAELASLGMEGFGEVFKRFHSGELEDDDEVALVHGPAELGYPAISVPMVNIRATLAAATQNQIITPHEEARLTEVLKQHHYPQRTYQQLKQQATALLSEEKSLLLQIFIEQHTVNIKKQDAVALLEHLNGLTDTSPGFNGKQDAINNKPVHHFARTDTWERLTSHLDYQKKLSDHSLSPEELVRELKLDGCFLDLKQQALCRKSALRTASSHRPVLTGSQQQNALIELAFRQFAYIDQTLNFDRLATWLASQGIDECNFDLLVNEQSLLAWLESIDPQLEGDILDILKLNNRYADYQARIAFKRQAPTLAIQDLTINEQQLWEWFFAVKHPDSPTQNPNDVWQILGFHSLDELKSAVVQDFQYQMQSGEQG